MGLEFFRNLMRRDTAPGAPVQPAPTVTSYSDELLREALKYLGTRESGGNNHGPEVEMFQRAVDGVASGEPWCMCFVQYCVKVVTNRFGIINKLYRSEHCLTVWNSTPLACRVALDDVQPGDIVIWQHGSTTSGHTGIIEAVNRDTYGHIVSLRTVEGNTSDASMREGDGVYRRVRSPYNNGTMKVRGFLRIV